MLICNRCNHLYYIYYVNLKALPPEEEKWFCKPYSRGVPPLVTRPEKKLSANKLLPQSLFPTREKNTEGEGLDSPNEIQKKKPLAT
jgi:hypothetical protein